MADSSSRSASWYRAPGWRAAARQKRLARRVGGRRRAKKDSRAGLAGGGAPKKTRYQPALTHPSWVNIKAGWYKCVSTPTKMPVKTKP
jgi:hypothetical protein